MATIITNQASVSYQYGGRTGQSTSNVATALLTDPVSLSKYALQSTYQAQDSLSFVVNFVNNGNVALNNLTLTDNMGTYSLGAVNVTPLTIDSLALLFIDGVYSGTLTPMPELNGITFTIASLPAGANAAIYYAVYLNGNAPLTTGSAITNTVTLSGTGITTPITASTTVSAASYADVSIVKSMSPTNVSDGSPLTYLFEVYNSGNAPATDIVLTDAFSPAPTNITVAVNGVTVDPSDYSYTGGVLTLPAGTGYSLSLPAAAITQNPATGAVTVTPSNMTITVTGTL